MKNVEFTYRLRVTADDGVSLDLLARWLESRLRNIPDVEPELRVAQVKCDWCDGRGWSCTNGGPDVEKCDACGTFTSDAQAARAAGLRTLCAMPLSRLPQANDFANIDDHPITFGGCDHELVTVGRIKPIAEAAGGFTDMLAALAKLPNELLVDLNS